MTTVSVAHLQDIDELSDGRCPFRPVRHHFGIATFGINAMTAHADGDRLINEHEEGANRAEALLAGDPPYPGLYYNTACFESQAGRHDAALAHLRRAVELLPEHAALARDDDDFAPVRDRLEFTRIIAD